MSRNLLIEEIEQQQMKEKVPHFDVGDTLKVSTKIVEGEKERIQTFQGTVIARTGSGISETFSLHRVSYEEGIERVFYLHSPRIIEITVLKKGDVRRAKLYYLRGTTGKASKVKEKLAPAKNKSKAANGASVASAKSVRVENHHTSEKDASEKRAATTPA